MISIHAPHAGSGSWLRRILFRIFDFNPRSPCGERHVERFMVMPVEKFQSTLPMRGAAGRIYALRKLTMISIHAPHAGSG